jgi:hypothetical protein
VSRLTPFELAFGESAARLADVADEAAAARKDPTDRAQFGSLPSVQRLLTDIEATETLSEHPEAAGEYLSLLYAAFRFWQAGGGVYDVERDIVDRAPTPRLPRVPRGACYVRFPERWLWAQIDETAPHEPIDGFFVAESADGRQLSVVVVLGLRSDREGVSQISIATAPEDLQAAAASVREEAFAPLMEGGRQAGFRSLASVAELLHLTRLALEHVAD